MPVNMKKASTAMEPKRAVIVVSHSALSREIRHQLDLLAVETVQELPAVWSEKISDVPNVDLVIAELPEDDALRTAEHLAGAFKSGVSVLALGRNSTVEFYHDLRRMGIAEYFPLATPAQDIAAAASALLKPQTDNEKHGRTVAVVATAPGIGAGMAAAVLARLVSEHVSSEEYVVAGDLGLGSPSLGSYFGMDAPGSLPLMLASSDRLDPVLIDQALVRPEKSALKVRLLDGYEPSDETVLAKPCGRLVREIAKLYPWQIWRVPDFYPISTSLIDEADSIVVIVTGSFASMRGAQRLGLLLSKRKSAENVLWVYSHRDATSPVSKEEAQKHLGVEFAAEIPYQKNLGQSFLAPGKWIEAEPLKKEFEPVVSRLGIKDGKSEGWWRRLWK